MARKESPLDMRLELLGTCVPGGDEDDPGGEVSHAVEYLVPLAEACRRLAEAVCTEAFAQADAILGELARLPEWPSLKESKRAAEFARRVQRRSAASLLFNARRGRLDVARVLEIAKTPRGLQMVAEKLGLPAELPEPVRASTTVTATATAEDGSPPPVITEFRGSYQFLSNFYPAPIVYCGKTYPSAEHLYQSRKATDYAERERIRVAPSAGSAKRLGASCERRADWDSIKDDVMREVIELKFAKNPDLAERLLATGDAELVEGNSWDDTYWGRSLVTGQGQNKLGVILMEVRASLAGQRA
jgi:ribA/ribD-fused uncharacterized protein